MDLASKHCKSCGRVIEPRRKWARNWDEIRYCSKACRSRRPGRREAALEQTILDLLKRCQRGATICPSEAARISWRENDDGWRALMEPVRSAARRLVARGDLEILQQGRVVEPSTARGPIRLRLTAAGLER